MLYYKVFKIKMNTLFFLLDLIECRRIETKGVI